MEHFVGITAGYAAGTIKTTGTDTSVTQQCPQGNITCGMSVQRKMMNVTGWQIKKCNKGCKEAGDCKPEYNPYILQFPVTLDTTFAGKQSADVQSYTACRERGTTPGVMTPCGLSYCPQRNDTEGLALEGSLQCPLQVGGQSSVSPTSGPTSTNPYSPLNSPVASGLPSSKKIKKRSWADGLRWAIRRREEPREAKEEQEQPKWIKRVIHLPIEEGAVM
ncbi:MAG: hypothetical protein M1814_004523 [Vezdaea aestivalis]|nr:MAG: hypothetical protein M1814_004523 [Vezdaea aestivalis]